MCERKWVLDCIKGQLCSVQVVQQIYACISADVTNIATTSLTASHTTINECVFSSCKQKMQLLKHTISYVRCELQSISTGSRHSVDIQVEQGHRPLQTHSDLTVPLSVFGQLSSSLSWQDISRICFLRHLFHPFLLPTPSSSIPVQHHVTVFQLPVPSRDTCHIFDPGFSCSAMWPQLINACFKHNAWMSQGSTLHNTVCLRAHMLFQKQMVQVWIRCDLSLTLSVISHKKKQLPGWEQGWEWSWTEKERMCGWEHETKQNHTLSGPYFIVFN